MTSRGTVAAGGQAMPDASAGSSGAGPQVARAAVPGPPHGVTSRRTQRNAVRVTAVLLAGLAVLGGRSWGRDVTRVPDIAAGTPVAAATAALRDAGLTAGRETRSSDEVGAGRVLDLRPSPGADVDPGSQVVLVVSSGPAGRTALSGRGAGGAAEQVAP